MDTCKPPPVLFQEAGTTALPDRPALLGGECAACGYVFFPMQPFGCERCGSAETRDRLLTGRGRVLSCATVHEHKAPGRDAPFTVGAVLLEDGPVVRALLEHGATPAIKIGDTVVSALVPETRPNRGQFDLRLIRETR